MSRKTSYVDNAMNRSLGRVGMAHGTCVQSSRSASTSSYGGAYSSNTGGSSYGGAYSSNTGGSSYGGDFGKSYVDNASNRSLGRVGKPVGSHVVHKDGSATVSSLAIDSTRSMSERSYVDNSMNRSLGRVGKPVGSHVVHKDGSATVSSLAIDNTRSMSERSYVDNSVNRSLGRVGKPVGSHVVHKDGSATVSSNGSDESKGFYVDNALNRKLGRVGKPRGTHVYHKDGTVSVNQYWKDLLREKRLDEVVGMVRDLHFHDPIYPAVVNAQHDLQRSEVEEKWKEDGIAPCTDHTQAAESMKEIIQLEDIDCHQKIGEGGFGKVYAGLWKSTIPIAFKKFTYQQITKKQQDLLVKEIKIFSSLNHLNIVKMFGVVLEKDNLGIVMEYLPKTLFHAIFVEEVKFSDHQKMRIIREVVSALEYLHTPNDSLQNPKPIIAHRDVKNQNILMDSNNVAKLCDFGLSAMKNSIQSSSFCSSAFSAQGTPRYAAPEVLRGELLQISGLMMSDIYSLSLVIYEILVEEMPYEELNVMQLLENVGRGTLRPTLDGFRLTESVKELLKKGWTKDAVSRPNIHDFSRDVLKMEVIFEDKQHI